MSEDEVASMERETGAVGDVVAGRGKEGEGVEVVGVVLGYEGGRGVGGRELGY